MKLNQGLDLGMRLAAAELPGHVEPIFQHGDELDPVDAFFQVGQLIESLVPPEHGANRDFENRRPGARGSQVTMTIPSGAEQPITAQVYTDYLHVPHHHQFSPNSLLKIGETWRFLGPKHAPGLDHFVKYSDIISDEPEVNGPARRRLSAIHDSVQIAMENRSLINGY